MTIIAIDHAVKMHELPDEYLADALPVAKKIAIALGAENYNILQVRLLHRFHVFFRLSTCVETEQWQDCAPGC